MTFTRKSADLTPIADKVFAIVSQARSAKEKYGSENVTDASIGSLYGEDGNLVAFDTVFDHYDALDHRVKAAYASSFSGNPSYRDNVFKWVSQGVDLKLAHTVIATPGGSGAVSLALTTFLDAGYTCVIPDIAWGNYQLMLSENSLNKAVFSMFEGDHFNLASLKYTVSEVMKKQDKIMVVVNDPCHNPTGYSMMVEEWRELVAFLNEVSRTHPVILVDDTAYIDYGYDQSHVRDYMKTWNGISGNVMITVAFSCSKMLTSYGLRCGAAIVLGQNENDVRQAEIVMEKKARSTWSNIANAAMDNCTWVITEGRDVFLAEKQKYIDLMKQRSSLFLKEADECGLAVYPYKEGFFVTLRMVDNQTRDKVHAAFLSRNIFTIQVNNGIRVAICSMPLAKIGGLAAQMKEVISSIGGN